MDQIVLHVAAVRKVVRVDSLLKLSEFTASTTSTTLISSHDTTGRAADGDNLILV